MTLTLYKTLTKSTQVYKAVRVWKDFDLIYPKCLGTAVCCLTIPAKTRVFISMGNGMDNNKCRAERAKPIWFKVTKPNLYDQVDISKYGLTLNYCYYDVNGNPHEKIPEGISFRSDFDAAFEYKLNEEVHCGIFTAKKHMHCAGGIHFFFRSSDAEEYLK